MSIAASAIVAEVRLTYPDLDGTTEAYIHFNEVDKIIKRVFRHQQDDVNLALTANSRVVDLDEGVIWVKKCRYVAAPNPTPNSGAEPGVRLEDTNEDELDTADEDYELLESGTPERFFQTHDEDEGQLGLDRPPENSTLVVTGATNASPIVITTGTHGLSDGDRVDIIDVAGNTAANGQWYAKVTGYSTTTFALYSDSDLSTAVAGNGAYTSGGIVSCEDSPYLKCKAVTHTAITSSTTMPLTPFLRSLYTEGIKRRWAEIKHPKDIGLYKATWDDKIAEQDQLTFKRAGRKERRIRTVKQRSAGYVTHARW